ncbi:Transcription initiation factor TFIID subunit 7 [Fulvia fulva]|uniref:Transcription initiation factor TFIID subunit 7 n=1 Tax=Passalora fulva TaxID=5499 RepID=A0A9Q8L5W9_PASFU|nr:Transcription initiation factor TFIID subunit 7 [Fulvia fulva]KAK4634550.1 Transcription initiation factor TFIID subunit 7 [Fulvia fulva]KAK4637835.1 Transcription initiation factor TFIID subunit 7 [Fulvia fulva]UJO11382.1 Transcription initiation factor TFIID subunit 7 [Fulvia fulva]WPV08265.1 Transcription initiation factor TFIID subunit 7 [Fulvia fulva]WPV24497.1 Transcription initiation factor TFIID subunit 7 [Fulvia fulva]
MIKLKLGKGTRPDGQAPPNAPAPSAASPQPQTTPAAPSAVPKLKLHVSQPPTPVDQPAQAAFPFAVDDGAEKKKRPYQRKQDGPGKGKKRAADDDTLPPPAKRSASGAQPARKISLKPPAPESSTAGMPKPKLRLGAAAPTRKPSVPKLLSVTTRGQIPKRPKGVGYDSEDSDVEKDPAIQQALVLRMEDGEDADYLRDAIANGKIGEPPSHGGAEVSIKFLERHLRRALIKIRGRMYGAVLVDLPTIVESMKSFDKKGWWKVADIAQMLLVLGKCNSEEEAKTLPLPREVNKETSQYAHGLTPPMRWARKRRFRSRMNQSEANAIDAQVAKLIEEDKEWEEKYGGEVKTIERREHEQSAEPQEYDEDDDADGEAVETVEMNGQDYDEDDEEDEGDDDLEAQLGLALDEDNEPMSELIAESPAPMADQAASNTIAEQLAQDDSYAATPVGTPAEEIAMTPQQQSSDEESDEDEDDPDEYDEDAAARAAERAQQMEEVADLEREVERGRLRMQAMNNQLLRQREAQKVLGLEEELTAKKRALGLEEAD